MRGLQAELYLVCCTMRGLQAEFRPRKGHALKKIIKAAIERDYTDLVSDPGCTVPAYALHWLID